ATHWAAASPATVPGPRPSYLSSASSLSRAARSAAVMSGEVVSFAPTGAAGAAGAAGAVAAGSVFLASQADRARIASPAADQVGTRIHFSLDWPAHYPRRGRRQGRDLWESLEIKRPVTKVTGPSKPTDVPTCVLLIIQFAK